MLEHESLNKLCRILKNASGLQISTTQGGQKQAVPDSCLTAADLCHEWPVDVRQLHHDSLSIHQEMLHKIHNGHQGITKCRERARQSVWWPGISRELEDLVQNCFKCFRAQRQTVCQLTPSPIPELPWKKIGTDLLNGEKIPTWLLWIITPDTLKLPDLTGQ